MQSNHRMMLNSTNDKRLSTEPLDEAMKELLEVCKQYNDKFTDGRQQQQQQQPGDSRLARNVTKSNNNNNSSNNNHNCNYNKQPSTIMNSFLNDKNNQHVNAATKCDTNNKFNQHLEAYGNNDSAMVQQQQPLSPPGVLDRSNSGSIEKLQQRQSELQSQLHQVQEIAKSLEAKQTRKLNSILEEHRTKLHASNKVELDDDDDDEDSELIEFQQIENELRISELNRQMSNIQEELRLRLYKRLLTKTSNGTKSTKERQQQQQQQQKASSSHNEKAESAIRRNSAQTDESTPPSSSCSDEPTTSSSISNSETINSRMFVETDLADQFERCNLTFKSNALVHSPAPTSLAPSTSAKSIDQNDSSKSISECRQTPFSRQEPALEAASCSQEGNTTNDLSSCTLVRSSQHNYEALRPATSNNGQDLASHISSISHNSQKAINANEEYQAFIMSSYAPNGLRSGSISNDLERIEEGEEEENEYYSNSSMFRKIYEEKLSPLLQAADNSNRSQTTSNGSRGNEESATETETPNNSQVQMGDRKNDELARTPPNAKIQNDYRFNMSNVNSSRRANRPLTMYMPKPDENIDLVELVQAMGHDLDIISDDLTVNPSSAYGYLYKSCSSKSKKWLKRFFYFDRNMKTLSYYETEEQLVKKNATPKSSISFDEIGDVYVDHRLSELSEKQKGARRKSYVFILATIKRKYVLASSKAETMRAWIDILFTAAKANDYFQQLDNDDGDYPPDCLDF